MYLYKTVNILFSFICCCFFVLLRWFCEIDNENAKYSASIRLIFIMHLNLYFYIFHEHTVDKRKWTDKNNK